MKDLVSVIIPIYNVEEYLPRCVESILAQTYGKLEILLIDDGSTDKSGDVADEYAGKDKRVKVVHKENGGLSDARNVGLENMSGGYVTFVDADDYVAADYIEELYVLLVESGADISSASFYDVYKNGRKVPSRTKKKKVVFGSEVAHEFLTDVVGNDNRAAWGKLFRKEIITDGPKFPVGKRHEDLVFLFESFCLSKKVAFVGKPLYYYVHRKNSITTSRSAEDYDYDMVDLADEVARLSSRFDFVMQDDVFIFQLEKRLSYIYSRVRKHGKITRWADVRAWLSSNKQKIISAKYISEKDKTMVNVIASGKCFAVVFFSFAHIVMVVLKRRGVA